LGFSNGGGAEKPVSPGKGGMGERKARKFERSHQYIKGKNEYWQVCGANKRKEICQVAEDAW